MNELETMLAKLLELAKDNPDLLFKITPNETYTNWEVEFTKCGYWWGLIGEAREPLSDVIKDVIPYFESLTDEDIQERLKEAEEE